MDHQPMRHEFKHLVNSLEVAAIRQRLAAVMSRDKHAGLDGSYRVRSLYFDNFDDLALQQKLDGVSRREKFRLRYYDDMNDHIRLEKKVKVNKMSYKESAWLTRAEAELLMAGSVSWLLDRPEPVLHDLYVKIKTQLLKPKAQIFYHREAFIYPAGNVRITIDSQIRSGLFATDFFNPDPATLKADLDGHSVIEVKFDNFLPGIITDIIQIGNRQSTALSKYMICRITG